MFEEKHGFMVLNGTNNHDAIIKILKSWAPLAFAYKKGDIQFRNSETGEMYDDVSADYYSIRCPKGMWENVIMKQIMSLPECKVLKKD